MTMRKKLGYAAGVALAGLALTASGVDAAEPEVTTQIPPGVEVVKFEYKIATHEVLKKYKKGADEDKPVLVFDITLKNLTDKPHKYQAFMAMPAEGKSTGGVIPRSSDKTIEPGMEESETYAAILHEMPKSITLVVQTLD